MGAVPMGSTKKAGGYDPAYGGIPQLPDYSKDTATTIGTDVQAQMLKNLPGYAGMSAADSANIQRNLAGSLAPDVISLMQQQAAERGIATGAPGSPNTDAAYLRALGLTSLQLQQLGHTQLTEAMQRTPIQQMQTVTQMTDLRPQQAIYNAAPIPSAQAAEQLRLAQAGMGAGYGPRTRSTGYTVTGGPSVPTYGGVSLGSWGGDAASAAFSNQWLKDPAVQSAIQAGRDYYESRQNLPSQQGMSYADWAANYGGSQNDPYPAWYEEETGEPYSTMYMGPNIAGV